MSARTHAHNSHTIADDSIFSSDYFGGDQASYLGDPSFESGSYLGGPAFLSATPTLYLTELGNSGPIAVTDINQGQLGDCFLLSPLGEEALFHPNTIMNMIHDNGNGTETVTLYVDKNGRLPTFNSTSFKATTVTVNNSFSASSVNNGANQDVLGNLKEIWPQVIEKAVATLEGGYNAIAHGGYPVLAMEVLTGQKASYMAPASLTLAALQKYVAAGDLITMDTSSKKGLGYGLVSNHCYMFDSIVGSGSSASVQLLNPWGFNQPAAIPLSKLAQSGIIEVDIGRIG